MIHVPPEFNAFEFARVAALRAAQLMRGCTPRVRAGFRPVLTAQLEVLAGKVQMESRDAAPHPGPFVRSDMEPVRPRVAAVDRRATAPAKPRL